MIEKTLSATQITQSPEAQPQKQKRVFRMVENDRMGGSMPVWETPKTNKQAVEQNLSIAQSGETQASFEDALAYNQAQYVDEDESFGFGDLIDMVNPFQHVPLVNTAYREITGDEIKPIGKIMGGTLFGGPIGAASGLANVIIEEETGKDITGNALAMVNGEMPSLKRSGNGPEQRLNDAAQAREELPASLLAFTNINAPRDSGIVIDRFDSFKTAATTHGHTPVHSKDMLDVFRIDVEENMNALKPRESISEIRIERIRSFN